MPWLSGSHKGPHNFQVSRKAPANKNKTRPSFLTARSRERGRRGVPLGFPFQRTFHHSRECFVKQRWPVPLWTPPKKGRKNQGPQQRLSEHLVQGKSSGRLMLYGDVSRFFLFRGNLTIFPRVESSFSSFRSETSRFQSVPSLFAKRGLIPEQNGKGAARIWAWSCGQKAKIDSRLRPSARLPTQARGG